MRVIIPVMAIGLSLVALSGCYSGDGYRDTAYRSGPTTTTTTTVVRDGNGNPLSSAQTVRDANGNTVGFAPPGIYQNGPPYYENGPIYPAQPYRQY